MKWLRQCDLILIHVYLHLVKGDSNIISWRETCSVNHTRGIKSWFSLSSLHSISTVSHCEILLARRQLCLTYGFQTSVREQQAARRFLPPTICLLLFISCACIFTASGPRLETNLCLQGLWERGSDLLDSTSFSLPRCLYCGPPERIDRNIWNRIVPSHGHIWSTIALTLKVRKHSSELKRLLVISRPPLFSQHGINVLMGGQRWLNPGEREQRWVGTYLSLSEVEVDGDLVAP